MAIIIDSLNVLIEIYQHRGVHPEVILDRAIEKSTGLPYDIDETLLCEIVEVNATETR